MRLRDVTFAWPGGARVFDRLNLAIDDSGLTLLIGPNGSGKTTLCRLLAGLARPQSGRIEREGEVVYLKQEPEANLVALTPALDTAVWRHRFHRPDTDDDRRACAEALAALGLAAQADQPAWELSGGQMRRTALAGLRFRPDAFWLLDEPESGLDDEGFALLRSMLAAHTAGALVVTHRPQKYADIPHRIINLNDTIEDPCD